MANDFDNGSCTDTSINNSHMGAKPPDASSQNQISNKMQHVNSHVKSWHNHSLERITKYAEYGGLIGMVIGGTNGARMARLRFYLEHQHYKMATKQDWYLYFKMKNYSMLQGFISGGLLMGCRVALLCTLYGAIEQSIAMLRTKLQNPRDSESIIKDPLNMILSVPILLVLTKKFYFKYYKMMPLYRMH